MSKDLQQNIDKALATLTHELAALRMGRATPSMLDGVKVDANDTLTPISHIASVISSDARTLVVKPWDTNLLKSIDIAIRKVDSNLNPVIEGKHIRISLPPPTEERRKKFAQTARHYGEMARVGARAARHEARRMIEAGVGSEDEKKHWLKNIDDIVIKTMEKIESLVEAKEKELASV